MKTAKEAIDYLERIEEEYSKLHKDPNIPYGKADCLKASILLKVIIKDMKKFAATESE